ncbi:hypothetical protein [Fluviispira vulneris]|uniref:hypothetical protein n=1 Tax=Fluviispira vulneris TaxID=2763012 RepID=UPI001648DC25|nr:hypothetical protein [Fluviispira vulneris]
MSESWKDHRDSQTCMKTSDNKYCVKVYSYNNKTVYRIFECDNPIEESSDKYNTINECKKKLIELGYNESQIIKI